MYVEVQYMATSEKEYSTIRSIIQHSLETLYYTDIAYPFKDTHTPYLST